MVIDPSALALYVAQMPQARGGAGRRCRPHGIDGAAARSRRCGGGVDRTPMSCAEWARMPRAPDSRRLQTEPPDEDRTASPSPMSLRCCWSARAMTRRPPRSRRRQAAAQEQEAEKMAKQFDEAVAAQNWHSPRATARSCRSTIPAARPPRDQAAARGSSRPGTRPQAGSVGWPRCGSHGDEPVGKNGHQLSAAIYCRSRWTPMAAARIRCG